MFKINVITPSSTSFFAAEELKKYLKMMMPRAGEVPIIFSPNAKDGFRIGLMSDFDLDTSDAEDIMLDDIVYIDTDKSGGIIAGSNPSALVIAVYRYLKFAGCRWLFPGVDGEWIPNIKELDHIKYRKLADHRYRGQCNEGAEFQQSMIETIDYTPKIGMNTYMMENDIPLSYYNRYYTHEHNPHRKDEMINNETVLKWKRECEAEIQKRGLHFHDMGHGWTAAPFGLDMNFDGIPDSAPKDINKYFALVDGKREIYSPVFNTNFCMSNLKNRKIVADYVADYAQVQNNVDFLHIWLSDGLKNHCECDECKKKTPSDWYVVLLNDIDNELTKRELSTHLVFIAYTDTFWAPKYEKFNNNKRFTMLYAPIFRKYIETYAEKHDSSAVTEFKLNKCEYPTGMGACLAYLDEWKKIWDGDCFCYEYHFWRHQFCDPSGLYLAKLIYDDVSALKLSGLKGMIEDGSQRSFFPTGFAYYVYGEMLFDSNHTFDELVEDYFSHAFGDNWREVYNYLLLIRDKMDFAYMQGFKSANNNIGLFYNPQIANSIREIPDIVGKFSNVIEKNLKQSQRASHVSWSMLDYFGKYVTMLSTALALKAEGKDSEATNALYYLRDEFGKDEIYIERYYDHYLAIKWLDISIFNFKTRLMQ